MGKWLVCTVFPEGMDGFFTYFAQIYCWGMVKNGLDFGDFDSIFKVTGVLRML